MKVRSMVVGLAAAAVLPKSKKSILPQITMTAIKSLYMSIITTLTRLPLVTTTGDKPGVPTMVTVHFIPVSPAVLLWIIRVE